jgi:uncharacterized protein (TIGR03083 family)
LITADGQRQITILRHHDPCTRVPSCPGWTLKDLLSHTAGAWRWATSSLRGGDAHQGRILQAAPLMMDELIDWAENALHELVDALAGYPPDRPTWTPVGRIADTRWWNRKMAIETAVHRWDAEAAVQGKPANIDPATALDGIDEHVTEFLPGILARLGADAPSGTLLLRPNDVPDERLLDLSLAPQGLRVSQPEASPDTVVRGSASDILLWMWNRSGAADVSSAELAARWKAVTI